MPRAGIIDGEVRRGDQARLQDRLRGAGELTFAALAADAESVVVVVARFLILLDLYREGSVAFSQASPLGELTVRWTAP